MKKLLALCLVGMILVGCTPKTTEVKEEAKPEATAQASASAEATAATTDVNKDGSYTREASTEVTVVKVEDTKITLKTAENEEVFFEKGEYVIVGEVKDGDKVTIAYNGPTIFKGHEVVIGKDIKVELKK